MKTTSKGTSVISQPEEASMKGYKTEVQQDETGYFATNDSNYALS